MSALGLPAIIQGGMGAAVSSWGLAKEVAKCGQLGVVLAPLWNQLWQDVYKMVTQVVT